MKHPTRSIALLGLSGVGKSTVAKLLSERLGWPAIDTDSLIVATEGRAIADIFASEGEAHFRDLESAALSEALDRGPAIIATGGGIVLRPQNRALLAERAFCVWLDAKTEALVQRLALHDEARPLLAGDAPARRLEALREARAHLYESLAAITVTTSDRSPAAVADHILGRFAACS